MSLIGKSDEQLDQMVISLRKSIQSMKAFKQWFESNPQATKIQIVDKFIEHVGNKDWRGYVIKHATKNEMNEKVQQVYDRSVNGDTELYQKVVAEMERRRVEHREQEAKKTTAKKMYDILERWLQTHNMDGRQLDCLELLIDEGTIKTAEQLAEYGVEV